MFRESKGIEYALEVLRVLDTQPDVIDADTICGLIASGARLDPSRSYLAKILPRLTKLGLLQSSDRGYKLAAPIATVMTDRVLALCDIPAANSPIYNFCAKLRIITKQIPITKLYDFGTKQVPVTAAISDETSTDD